MACERGTPERECCECTRSDKFCRTAGCKGKVCRCYQIEDTWEAGSFKWVTCDPCKLSDLWHVKIVRAYEAARQKKVYPGDATCRKPSKYSSFPDRACDFCGKSIFAKLLVMEEVVMERNVQFKTQVNEILKKKQCADKLDKDSLRPIFEELGAMFLDKIASDLLKIDEFLTKVYQNCEPPNLSELNLKTTCQSSINEALKANVLKVLNLRDL